MKTRYGNRKYYKNLTTGDFFIYEDELFIVTDRPQAHNDHALKTAVNLTSGLTWEIDAFDKVLHVDPTIAINSTI